MQNEIEFIEKDVVRAWKPVGLTPLDQLKELQRIFNITHKKGCYVGRLDPMASGMMIYLFGDATKMCDKYMKCDKTYEFYMVCGISTDSMDSMGHITNVCLDDTYKDRIDKLIYNINTGKYNNYQQPMPACSAYNAKHKITGQRRPLWYWSKHNELDNVQFPPPSNINIRNFNVLNVVTQSLHTYIIQIINEFKKVRSFDQKLINECVSAWIDMSEMSNDTNIILLRCSATVGSGTYIRYLTHMIGEDVGVYAHSFDITRTRIILPN